jgi:hypothetical protein
MLPQKQKILHLIFVIIPDRTQLLTEQVVQIKVKTHIESEKKKFSFSEF